MPKMHHELECRHMACHNLTPKRRVLTLQYRLRHEQMKRRSLQVRQQLMKRHGIIRKLLDVAFPRQTPDNRKMLSS